MIKVVFKEKYGKLGEQEYTYSAGNFTNLQVGDEVIVNTRYGLALAVVTQTNIQDNRFFEEDLQKVVLVAESAIDKKTKEEAIAAKTLLMKKIAEEAKRNKLLSELQLIVNAEDFEKYVANMTLKDLEELYFELM